MIEQEELEKLILFNQDQIAHVSLVQHQTLLFTTRLLKTAIEHDQSKFSKEEYETFINSRTSLRTSKDGKDQAYQDAYKTQAIQHHVNNNPHHAEYWDSRNERMPVREIIAMYLDWRSRAMQKSKDPAHPDMTAFWEFNEAKLVNQPHALALVRALKYDDERDDLF